MNHYHTLAWWSAIARYSGGANKRSLSHFSVVKCQISCMRNYKARNHRRAVYGPIITLRRIEIKTF